MKKNLFLKSILLEVAVFAVAAVFIIQKSDTAFAAENTTAIRPYTPYVSTYSHWKYIKKQGDSAVEARDATTGKAGVPYRVGKFTKPELNTMNAQYVLELLTGDFGVYDNRGNYLGTSKAVFNGVWGDLNPAKALQIEGGDNSGGYKMGTPDVSKFDPNVKKETTEKLYIPPEAVYCRLQNIKATGKKYTLLSELTIPMWNEVAQYSEVFDKDFKPVKFTRKNGKTY